MLINAGASSAVQLIYMQPTVIPTLGAALTQFPPSVFDAYTFGVTLNARLLSPHLLPHKVLRVGAIYAYYQNVFLTDNFFNIVANFAQANFGLS